MGKVYFLFYYDCAPVHRATPIDAQCDELSVEKPEGPTASQTLFSDISELSPAMLEGREHLYHLAVFLGSVYILKMSLVNCPTIFTLNCSLKTNVALKESCLALRGLLCVGGNPERFLRLLGCHSLC